MNLLIFRCFCVLFFIIECANSAIRNPFSSISMCFKCTSTANNNISYNIEPEGRQAKKIVCLVTWSDAILYWVIIIGGWLRFSKTRDTRVCFTDPWWFDVDENVLGNSAVLSDDTKPLHYWLEITPNSDARTYKGDLTIKIKALRTTTTIKLNYEQLDIQDVTVVNWDLTGIKIKSRLRYDQRTNQLIIYTRPTKLHRDVTYKVKILFKGFLYQSNPFGFAWYQSGGPLGKPDAYVCFLRWDKEGKGRLSIVRRKVIL